VADDPELSGPALVLTVGLTVDPGGDTLSKGLAPIFKTDPPEESADIRGPGSSPAEFKFSLMIKSGSFPLTELVRHPMKKLKANVVTGCRDVNVKEGFTVRNTVSDTHRFLFPTRFALRFGLRASR